MTRKFFVFFAILGFLFFLSACDGSSSIIKDSDYSDIKKTNPDSSTTGSIFGDTFGGSEDSTISSRGVFSRVFSSNSRRDGPALHAIIVADTDDSSIGKSVKVDLKRMEGLVKDIANKTGLSITGGSIFGETFTKSNILAAVNSLSVGSNDVVWFYNSSHGFNSGGSKWPDIHDDAGGIPLNEIADIIKTKNPRLSIVMADVCNKPMDSNRNLFNDSSIRSGKPANYKELFLNHNGSIIASSSIEGQYSWGNEQKGGLFTNVFFNELDEELMSNQRPSWDALMNRATQVIPLPNNTTQAEQEPQAEVNVSAVGNWSGVDCERNPNVSECQIGSSCPITDPNCPNYVPPPNKSSPFSSHF